MIGDIFHALPLPDDSRPRIRWAQLHGSAVSLAVAEAAGRHSGPICVIAATVSAADRLEHEVKFFTGRPTRRFPDYETLPYESISPPQDLLADRLLTLYELARGAAQTLIVDAGALLSRLPPPDFVLARSLVLTVGDRLDRAALTRRLTDHGYLRVEQVTEPGEFAVRGALLDVYPTGNSAPVRIDLLDDEIETLRTFDPQTQLSAGATDSIRILPAREFPFDEAGIKGVSRALPRAFPGRARPLPDLSHDLRGATARGHRVLLAAVLCKDRVPLRLLAAERAGRGHGRCTRRHRGGWELIVERHGQLDGDIEHPILPPRKAFGPQPRYTNGWIDTPTLTLAHAESPEESEDVVNAGTSHPLAAGVAATEDSIERWLDPDASDRTLVVTSSPGHREMMLELLHNRKHNPEIVRGWREYLASNARLAITVGELAEGMRIAARKLRLITAAELGMERPRQRVAAQASARPRGRDSRAHGSAGRRAGRARGLRHRPLSRA